MNNSEKMHCMKCGGDMIRGFQSESQSRGDRPVWIEGDVWSYMLGWSKPIPVATYCCARCGYLESFAQRPAESTTALAGHAIQRPEPRRHQHHIESTEVDSSVSDSVKVPVNHGRGGAARTG